MCNTFTVKHTKLIECLVKNCRYIYEIAITYKQYNKKIVV